jgi:peptidyl-prolyl cis-trans isomerase B (cyclophilin B)
MASTNQRRRQVARAKFERQELRRSLRARRRRRTRRVALVVAIVVVTVLLVIGVYWVFFAGATSPVAASVSVIGRTSPSFDHGGIW